MSYDELRNLGVVFRPIDTWPGVPTRNRRWSSFSASFSSTMALLGRELAHLHATHVVCMLAIEESDLRLDGMPRARAQADHPGVVIAFDSKYGPLKYATDEFYDWQENLRAIALSMEALRKVDRYGVSKRGEQYTGWRALPAYGESDLPQTRDDAERVLEEWNGDWKAAARDTHPDVGGDPSMFRRVMAAKELLA